MADDLDEFLKQAAQRRAQRQQQKGKRQPAQMEPPPQLAPPPRMIIEPVPTAEIVQYPSNLNPTVGNLATSLPTIPMHSTVSQADDRMNSHLQRVFQHEIGNLKSTESKPSKQKSKKQPQAPAPTTTPSQPSDIISPSSLVEQLRNPQTLRMAIIAHEVLKRPWS